MTDVTALGEILIDFTPAGRSDGGQPLFEQNPGGAPANVLAQLAKCGDRTSFIGKVGDDAFGRYLVTVLRDCGIRTDGVAADPDVFTTLAFVSLAENGERDFSFARKPGADTCLRPEELRADLIEESRVFHVGSLSLTAEPSRGTTFRALEIAKKAGCMVSYDPNYRAPLWSDEETAAEAMRSVVPYADLMKLSAEETVLLTGEQDPAKAAAELVRRGVSVVAVTLGADGALVATKEGTQTVPGFRTDAVDTTGAGDSFWGMFLHCVLESGLKPEEIPLGKAALFARLANAAASLCVERRGAIPAMPSYEEARNRMLTVYPSANRKKRNEFAVLVPIVETKDGPAYLFEVRSPYVRQPNEICFPGGRMEEGEEPEETAVREAEEELGIPRGNFTVIRRLKPHGMSDGRVITPVVAKVRKGALHERRLDDFEVGGTFLIPLAWFRDHEPRYFELATVPVEEIPPLLAKQLANYPDFHRRGTTFYWEYENHGIWGLTSRILTTLNHEHEGD